LVFEEVQADLEKEGYEVWAFLLPACGVNAPHRRDRVWFVAYNISKRLQRSECAERSDFDGNGILRNRPTGGYVWSKTADSCNERPTPNTDNGQRIEQAGKVQAGWDTSHSGYKPNATNANSRRQPCEEHGQTKSRRFTEKGISSTWEKFPTQPPVRGGDDGLPTELDGITFPKWRNESIKAAGNAIVPQVVLQIFKTIEQFESLYLNPTNSNE
jgi:DNA (cytosine-5)-methyltransferase 1